eukprot:1160840-Pelagomonas_calceolata.AAC.10
MGVPRTAFLALAAVLSLSGSAALAAGAPLSSLYAVSLLMGRCCAIVLAWFPLFLDFCRHSSGQTRQL